MREQLKARLAELKAEMAVGEQRWREGDVEQARLRETLMRMSGAIQVITELLEEEEGPHPAEDDGASTNGVPMTAPTA
jgi:predicted nuclease with TOPRIM domain